MPAYGPLPESASDASDATPDGAAPGTEAVPGDDAAFLESASRKMHHHDGKGCLEDLARVSAKPAVTRGTQLMRAQCGMLVGRCQAGKKVLADYYVAQTNMSVARAEQTAERMGAIYCRGGDSTPRDRLLRAQQELQNGAYLDPRTDCEANVQLIRKLAPKVSPRDEEDTAVTAIPKSLYHMGASCHARAGDCKAAWRTFRENYPQEVLAKVAPDVRDQIVRSNFGSLVQKCKDLAPP